MLAGTLTALAQQQCEWRRWEVVVVDDGSRSAAAVPSSLDGVPCRLVRLPGVERSAARNAGVRAAAGDILVFLDDDMRVGPHFVTAHVDAQSAWPQSLAVGLTRLPDETLDTPFGRFRQVVERVPVSTRGPVTMPNFCTAGNMSMRRDAFLRLGGFDETLVTGEDQDLALRHTASGGTVVFVPEAVGLHCDRIVDIRSYCRRVERASGTLVGFCRRHPDWPDNIARQQINDPPRPGREPARSTIRKVLKQMSTTPAVLAAVFTSIDILERTAPESPWLDRLYRVALGAHIRRGFRRGTVLAGHRSRP